MSFSSKLHGSLPREMIAKRLKSLFKPCLQGNRIQTMIALDFLIEEFKPLHCIW